MSQDHPIANGADDREALETLLAGALQAHDDGGEAAVLAFVAAHPEHGPALREALADLDTIDLLRPAAPPVPEWLGEFRLRAPLGAGGMGIVYLAEQTSLGREVALKVVRPELLFFDGARERFRREIDAVARLEHPAIVPILATGHAEGVPYYAMPRIRGRSAEAVCRALAGREPAALSGADLRALLQPDAGEPVAATDTVFAGPWWRTVVLLAHQATLGIAHAHARGVLHRDLKPSNLMLTEDGRAIVLDFGLAVARGDAKLTRTGTAAGSPAFMAPEQVRGEGADERTDIYGMAATLHSLLGLAVPFAATGAEALKSQILAGARRSLQHAALPAELQLVLAQAMDVEPARRYRTAIAFADDLQAVLDGRPITARGLPVRVRLQRFARRHRALTTALVAVALFVLVVPSVLLWQQRLANDLLSEQVRRSDHSAKVGVDTIEDLLAAVARERMLYVSGGQEVAADMLRSALGRFDELAADRSQSDRVAVLRIRTLQRLADVEKARGRLDDALAASRRAAQLCGDGELTGEARLRRGEANRVLAGLLIDSGLSDEARELIAACRQDLEPLAALPEWRSRAMTNLAALHGHAAIMASRGDDLAAQEQALGEAIRCYAEAGAQLCQAYQEAMLAGVLIARGRPEQALVPAAAALAKAVDPHVRADDWPTPRFIEGTARMVRGRALQLLGQVDEAIVEQQRALTLFDAFLLDFPDEPVARRARGVTSHSLAQIHANQKRWLDARLLLERACADQRRVLELLPATPGPYEDLCRHSRKLAQCLEELGDFAALEPLARRVGAMQGDPLLPLCGAHGLLSCAAAADEPTRAAALREEALLLWLESARRGRPLDFDDAVFRPLHADPRVAALRSR
ncbi:MAG TPA: serine/threonine-protein kinase [Planctomycetota bacterium]|nr:serine/threonine-protein kinase [Planctomycetota bacterium]